MANAARCFDAMLAADPQAGPNLDSLISAILRLWGDEGRHLLNFGVLGFAYFLAKNAPRFFDRHGLAIKSARARVCEKRGHRDSNEPDRSDFGKLASLKARWQTVGDQLWINASRDPVRIAGEINVHFLKNRPRHQRIWQPENTL